MTAQIVLFDIDGVLLHPGGYRAGVRQSIAYFLSELGLADHWLPDESEIATFESIGVTAEWDMIPIWLAIVIESFSRNSLSPVNWPDWPSAASWVREVQIAIERPAFIETIRAVQSVLLSGVTAAGSVYQACLQGRFEPLRSISHQGVVRELMSQTLDLTASRTTQVLQTFVLGSETYTRLLGQAAPVSSQSALEAYDRPNILPEVTERLEALRSQKRLAVAVFTARPSAPPDGRVELRVGYTPEAESALRLLGLSNIPLVGYGAMMHIAERVGLSGDHLLKPAPFQALSAASAAWTGELLPALEWAYGFNARCDPEEGLPVLDTNHPLRPAPLPDQFDLHVFEDAPNGIRSARRAAELLRMNGITANVRAWGIAGNGDKKTALERVGAVVYADVNQAIRAAFPDWF